MPLRMLRREVWLVVFSSLLTLIVGDVSLNLLFGSIYKPDNRGWAPGPNRSQYRTVEDQPGDFRTVQSQAFTHGFKRWGEPHTSKTKVLIIGDSFTQMNVVANGEEWYAYLENAFRTVEWFVHGGGGYGTLQEYMVLNNYFDEIAPDLILWQFCSNDYANNLYDWDRKTYPYSNFRFRPYLENGQIIYRLPLPLPSLRKYSKTADLLLSIYDTKMKESKSRGAPAKPTAQEKAAAYRVTRDLLIMVRERVGGKPLFFLASTSLAIPRPCCVLRRE